MEDSQIAVQFQESFIMLGPESSIRRVMHPVVMDQHQSPCCAQASWKQPVGSVTSINAAIDPKEHLDDCEKFSAIWAPPMQVFYCLLSIEVIKIKSCITFFS